MDIKRRLSEVLQRHSNAPFPIAVVENLARDALAEIERMERCVDAARARLRLADIQVCEAQTRLAESDEELKGALRHWNEG